MENIFNQSQINYIIRTYLPTWRYQERINELIQFCNEVGAKYVMLFTDAQHMVWNQLTLEEAKKEADNIHKAKERLIKEGIRLGINSTYNMPMSRFDHRKHNDYDYFATKKDRTCEYRTPCLLDPKLDKYLKQFYTILAEIKPDYIYVDDDHRYILVEDGTFGCFCDLHLRKFGEITGETWTREKLNKALKNKQSIRKVWIEFLGKRLVEISNIIREAVHSVYPEIRVGMMMPCIHPLPVMGHNIINVLNAFKGTGKSLIRPCIEPYSDHNRRQIIPELFYMEYTGYLLGDNAEYTLEIETTPFTRFSKSMTVVRFHIASGILNRMNTMAISTCGYIGDSAYLEPAFVNMLRDNKNFFEGVRKIAPERGTRKGIQFIWDFDSAKLSKHKINDVTDLFWPAFTCHEIIGNMGFSYTYDESHVKFLAGDSVRAFSKERITEIFKGGVVLDVLSAQALIDLGYKDMIGCEIGESLNYFAAEECLSQEFCGRYINTYIPLKFVRLDGVFRLKPEEKAIVVSRITGHNREEISPGVVLFKNSLGGRIAILPYIIFGVENDLRHMICYQRRFMFKQIFKWMDPKVLTLFVEEPSDFAIFVWENKQNIVVCITNLSYDKISEIKVEIYRDNLKPENAFYVSDDGSLQPLANKIEIPLSDLQTTWKIRHEFFIFNPFIMILQRNGET